MSEREFARAWVRYSDDTIIGVEHTGVALDAFTAGWKAALSTGVPAGSPEPVAWLVRYRRGSTELFKFEEDARSAADTYHAEFVPLYTAPAPVRQPDASVKGQISDRTPERMLHRLIGCRNQGGNEAMSDREQLVKRLLDHASVQVADYHAGQDLCREAAAALSLPLQQPVASEPELSALYDVIDYAADRDFYRPSVDLARSLMDRLAALQQDAPSDERIDATRECPVCLAERTDFGPLCALHEAESSAHAEVITSLLKNERAGEHAPEVDR